MAVRDEEGGGGRLANKDRVGRDRMGTEAEFLGVIGTKS